MSAAPGAPSFANRQAFGPAEDPSLAVAVGDMDGDGYLDLVVGNDIDAPGYIYLNDTRGNFYNGPVDCDSPPANVRCFSTAAEGITTLAVGDIDSDGDLDIITGSADIANRQGTQNVIYLNDGQGNVHYGASTCGTTPGVRCFGSGSDRTFTLAVGDMNGDAHLDIVVGNSAAPNMVYFNDGSAAFPESQNFGTGLDGTWTVDVGDINGDAALDIVVGNFGEQNRVYLNQGAGSFHSGSVTCGSTPDVLCLGSGSDTTTALVVGDINRDRAPDVVIANRGVFDTDCACYRGEQNTLYLNDGSGSFPATSSYTRTLGLSSDATVAVALGDMDSDGYLDVLAGNDEQPNAVYLNETGSSFAPSIAFGTGTGTPWGIALADLDRDSDLDIVVVKDIDSTQEQGLQNEIYFNDGRSNFAADARSTFGAEDANSSDVALGDMDGDGDLDIVTANMLQQDSIAFNDGSGSFADTAEATNPVGAPSSDSQSVAVGAIDSSANDSLDIVIGQYGGQNAVYFNDGAGSFATGSVICGVTPGVSCFGTGSDTSTSMVLADINGDGALDIAAGNDSLTGQNAVYLNDGAGNFFTGRLACDSTSALRCFGSGSDNTRGIAAGDMDQDGDLDLVVANHNQQNAVHLNDGSGAFPDTADAVRPFGNGSDNSTSVAVGDVDGDGDLDIVIGNQLEQDVVYLNNGAASFYSGPIICGANAAQVRCVGTGLDRTSSTALADIDGDGDLDIISGSSQGQGTIYLNDSLGNFPASRALDAASDAAGGLAAADIDQDGDTDLVVAYQDGHNLIYRNGLVAPVPSSFAQPSVMIERPGSTPDAGGFSVATILEETVIPIDYRLVGGAGQRVGLLRAFYSLDGGGNWLPARNTAGQHDIVPDVMLPAGPQVFEWDTFQSGFFGQSDNVVFRIEVYPDARTGANQPGARTQRPYLAAQTQPFRVRGTQVRVVCEDCATPGPAADALVYRLSDGLPIAAGGDEQGQDEAFRTNALGYLEGRGALSPQQEQLMALYPVEITDKYTLYYTNGVPTNTGVRGQAVEEPGVQTITVSSARPLLLFNLDVSLEWDARNDERFLSRLEFDLRRTSELLYDWTNGQAALGRLTIYHNREQWDNTNIRIYATNRLRPNADQGGIVSEPISETVTLQQRENVIEYAPGQVRMAAVWNRFGDADGNLSEDWPRTLAHELGHYVFYLDDNYLGLDSAGRLIAVETCPGAMSDPYNEGYSEFHPGGGWLPSCEDTLSNTSTGRSDWTTISTFYAALQAPGVSFNNLLQGPSTLPLAVTEMDYVETGAAAATLDVPIFYLKDQQGTSVQPGLSARAFVFQEGDALQEHRLIDVGRPIRDYIEARGARVGDRVCMVELANERQACETIVVGDEEIEVVQRPEWQPDIRVSPVTSTTIDVDVSGVPADLNLCARLFPEDNLDPSAIGLEQTAAGEYAGRFEIPLPAPGGYIHIFDIDEPADSVSCSEMGDPEYHMVTDYSLGGNPGRRHSKHAPVGKRRSRNTPTVSADGQVILYGDNFQFDAGTFYTLQEATIIPSVPPWTTPVGQAYRLSKSDGAPDLSGTSLSFGYLGNQVPAGEEEWLRLYFWDEPGQQWIQLDTLVDRAQNIASAPTQGEGLYALMSSIEITLEGSGWNLFSYPVNATRPLPDALQSIEGYYSTVYSYQTDRAGNNRWRMYDVGAPDWLNNDADMGLQELAFGKAYLINVTRPITVSLKGASTDEQQTASRLADAVPHPPATYYHEDLAASAVPTATVGMPVTAWVNERLCGENTVRSADDKLVFAVQVQAELPGDANGCGAAGRQVRIDVGGQTISRELWNNNRARALGEASYSLYLPMIRR